MREPLRLLARLASPHRRRLLGLLAVGAGQGACAVAAPWLVGVAIDTGIPRLRNSDAAPLAAIAVAIVGSAVAAGFLQARWFRGAGTIGQAIVLALRTETFHALRRLSVAYHERVRAGDVIARQTADTEAVTALLGTPLATVAQSAFTLVFTTAAMLLLDVELAAVTLAALLPLAALLAWQARQLGPAFRAQRAASAESTAQLVEALNGIRVVQAFGRQGRNDEAFASSTGRLRSATTRILTLRGILWPVLELVFSLAALVVVVVGGLRVAEGSLRVGVLAAFLLYVAQFFAPVTALPLVFDSLQAALAGLDRIGAILAAEPPGRRGRPARPARAPSAW